MSTVRTKDTKGAFCLLAAGFTLIELLVMIAIICILVLVLLSIMPDIRFFSKVAESGPLAVGIFLALFAAAISVLVFYMVKKMIGGGSYKEGFWRDANGVPPSVHVPTDPGNKSLNANGDECVDCTQAGVKCDPLDSIGRVEVRLVEEMDRLQYRGALNLGIGIVLGVGGVVLLGVMFHGEFFQSKPAGVSSIVNTIIEEEKDSSLLGYIYASRVSFVMVVEFLAYFFLKLYKLSLADLRYYHNELSNLALKRTALETSLQSEGDERNLALIEVIKVLVNSDRNGILEKGQSTVEIEKLKHADHLLADLLKEAIVALRGKTTEGV